MMKNILFILVLFGSMHHVAAQMYISTYLRKDAVFNEKTEEYDLLSEDKEELTFFEFNKEFTMFKHTTPTITSAYTINSSTNDKENGRLEFDIISDVGNKYLMILDVNNSNVRFIYKTNGKTYLVLHLIKKIWADDNDDTETSNSSDDISTGTGFAISSLGYIVTNFHVIENAKSIKVKGVNANNLAKYSAEVVVADEKNDLAILKISDPSFTNLGTIPYIFRQGIADVGENVFVLGYPMTNTMGEEIKLTNGIISSKTGFKGDISTYQVSVPIQPGNSGGPLFDKKGNILGVVNAKHTAAENVSYAIKVSYLKNLIELLPHAITLPTISSLSDKSLTDQVKLASKFTYLIIINDDETSKSVSTSNDNTNDLSSADELAASYYERAQELLKDDDVRGSLEQINLAIEASPNYAGFYFFRGSIYLYGIKNYDKAVDDLTKAIQMEPDFEMAYYYRGLAYENLEKDIEAIKDFTKVISLNSENMDAYFMRGLLKSKLNDRNGAILDYDEIIKRENTFKPDVFRMGTVYNNKGYCLIELNRFDEALFFINKALVLDPNESYIWGSRGELHYKTGDYRKCISDMKKAIEVSPKTQAGSTDPGLPYYLMGLSKIKLGEKEAGCKDLSKAGELGKTEAFKAIAENCK